MFQTTQDKWTALVSRQKLSERDRACELFKERRFEKGVGIFEAILEDQTELLGRNHEDTLDTIFLLGRGLLQWEKYDIAGDYFAEFLEGQIENSGSDHEQTFHSLYWLGLSKCLDGKYAEAVTSLEPAAKGYEDICGLHSRETWESLKWLGRSLTCLKRLPQAESVTSLIFESKQQTLGPNHEETLDAWYSLLEIYYQQSRYQEAEEATYRLLQIQRRTLGPTHKNTIRSLEFIVSIFSHAEHSSDERLEAVFDDLSQHRAVTLGPIHEYTLDALQWLGIVRYEINKLPEAEEALYRASGGQKEIFGIGHGETLRSLWFLAETLRNQEKYHEEFDVREEVVTGHLILFGDKHEKTLKAQDELVAANQRLSTFEMFQRVNNSSSDLTENLWPRPAFMRKASVKMRALRDTISYGS